MALTNEQKKRAVAKTPPQVKPISELPEFAKRLMGQMWAKYGTPKNLETIVCTYFDAIYTKSAMPQDLFVHECVHYVRQGSGEDEGLAQAYCERYVKDEKFRYEEELLAYREQYRFILSKSNKPVAFEHAKRLAHDLASPMYGGIVSESEALLAIIKK